MNERQLAILKTIIREYIATAAPVSSQQVLNASQLDVSSATVRNDMVRLEREGLIIQPHTSAGRVPTQAAYQLYIDQFLDEKPLAQQYVQALRNKVQSFEDPRAVKFIAKGLAEISGLLAFVAFDRHDIYYTGLSQLLSQPEFVSYDRVYDFSKVVDQLDDVIEQLYDKIDVSVRVMLGDQNPFGPQSAAIITRYTYQDQQGIIGLLGPMRMDYDVNIALINYLQEELT
jgi:heat-inducible transcriptional repressor